MKVGTLKEGGRDGRLVLVSRDNKRFIRANGIAETLQQALDDWDTLSPQLEELSRQLNADPFLGSAVNLFEFHFDFLNDFLLVGLGYCGQSYNGIIILTQSYMSVSKCDGGL